MMPILPNALSWQCTWRMSPELRMRLFSIRCTVPIAITAWILTVPSAKADARAEGKALSACDTPVHHQFDFWLGDWQVFDTRTSQLVAFDRIEKQLNGCAVVQNLIWLSDQFRRPELN